MCTTYGSGVGLMSRAETLKDFRNALNACEDCLFVLRGHAEPALKPEIDERIREFQVWRNEVLKTLGVRERRVRSGLWWLETRRK